MQVYSAQLRLLFTLLLALLPVFAHAAVPNRDAVPAYAEEQTLQQTEKDTPAPGWLSPQSGRHDFDRHYIVPFGNTSEQMVILQRGGDTWRSWRNGPLALIAGTLMIVVPILIWGFYLKFGPSPLTHPETGRTIERFNSWQRTIHWATAISFLVLAFSGLIIAYGKKLILPWAGHFAFSWVAIISKYLHNFFGPLFILCSIALFVTFVRENFWRRWDWEWMRKGGGLTSHQEAPAGYFNAGEKLYFWAAVFLLGLLMSATGLMLDFVNFGQTRYLLQISDWLHFAGAAFYIVAAMGHIYIGTLGTPGAWHAMRYGTVDEEWAREHHPIWFEELKSGRPAQPEPPAAPAAPARPQA